MQQSDQKFHHTPVSFKRYGLLDFPDPTLTFWQGEFYAIATSPIKHSPLYKGDLQLAKSKDLLNWELLEESVLLDYPEEAEKHKEFWAPEISFQDGKFRLDYTFRKGIENKGSFGIAVAFSDKPFGFKSHPTPLVLGDGFRYIDSFRYVEQSAGGQEEYLLFGSHHQPISIAKLDATGTKIFPESVQALVTPKSHNFWDIHHTLYEGAFLHKQLGKYFLYIAGGDTWMSYAQLVFASDELFGPYQFFGKILTSEEDYLRPEGRCVNPGQMSILTHGQRHYTVYHSMFIDPEGYIIMVPGTQHRMRVMCIAEVDYSSGMPNIIPLRSSIEAVKLAA